MSKLTHFDERGQAHMVDIGEKAETRRVATASGAIYMQPATLDMIATGSHKKGDVLGIARIAGIMASKKAADVIPLCHPLMLTRVTVDFELDQTQHAVHCRARTEVSGKTGVEIEALYTVQTALLTIYDMCKAIDRGMRISDVQLDYKSGGKSGTYQRDE